MKVHYLLMAALVGCAEPEETPPDSDAVETRAKTCADETVVALNYAGEVAPWFTFAADDVVSSIRRTFSGDVVWADGIETLGLLDATGAGREVRAMYPANSLDGEIDASCPPYCQIDLGANLSDEDGRLSETFTAELVITTANTASFSMTLSPSQLRGDLRAQDKALAIDGAFDHDGWDGTLAWEQDGVQETLGSFDFR
jgi:hypothetical protein